MISRSGLATSGRIALFLLALSAGVFAVHVARQGTAEQSGARYVCPMHPEVTSQVPGNCSICRMKLVPAVKDSEDALKAQLPPAESRTAKSAFSVEAADLLRYGISIARRHAFPQNVSAPAWVDEHGTVSAVLYRDEAATVTLDETALFTSANAPSEELAAKRIDEPPSDWDSASYRIRFTLPAGAHLPTGSVGSLELAHKTREALAVPESAVLHGPEGPYVLVLSLPGRSLDRRRVQVGRTLTGMTAIVSGLRDRELVVAMNAFLMDAEWQARAANMPEGEP